MKSKIFKLQLLNIKISLAICRCNSIYKYFAGHNPSYDSDYCLIEKAMFPKKLNLVYFTLIDILGRTQNFIASKMIGNAVSIGSLPQFKT